MFVAILATLMGYLYDKYNFVMKNNEENVSRFSQSYKTVTWLILKKLTEPFSWINIITPLNKLWASLQTSCFNNRKKVIYELEISILTFRKQKSKFIVSSHRLWDKQGEINIIFFLVASTQTKSDDVKGLR